MITGEDLNTQEVDRAEGARLVGLSADQGFSNAQCELGNCYNNGSGVPADGECAVKLYKQAVTQGDAFAQRQLGLFHLLGRGGLPQNRDEALSLLKLAAAQGDEVAIAKLRELGVSRNAAAAGGGGSGRWGGGGHGRGR